MKNTILGLLLASILPIHCVLGQPAPSPNAPPPGYRLPVAPAAPEETKAVRFDLDFKGGTPRDLINAIGKASGKPVNAIIPDEYAKFQLPALKMTSVTVSDLFTALQRSSVKVVKYSTGPNSWQQKTTSYGFSTQGNGDAAVWYFNSDSIAEPPRAPDVCRFYQLDYFLGAYKIEDITTAIKTGWEMLHVTNPPSLKFHPETKLLIAVGPDEQLSIISSVLQSLENTPTMKNAIQKPTPEIIAPASH